MKTALPGEPITVENLERERSIYRLASVSSAKCFRQTYDIFDDDAIALE